jgi:hypothetical protein
VGSILDEVIGIFTLFNSSSLTIILGFTQFYFLLTFSKRKIDYYSIMNTDGVRLPTKQLRDFLPLPSAVSQDLALSKVRHGYKQHLHISGRFQ